MASVQREEEGRWNPVLNGALVHQLLIGKVCWPLTRGEMLDLVSISDYPTLPSGNMTTTKINVPFFLLLVVLLSPLFFLFPCSLILFSNFNSLSVLLPALPALSPNFSFHGSSLLSSFEPKLLLFNTIRCSLTISVLPLYNPNSVFPRGLAHPSSLNPINWSSSARLPLAKKPSTRTVFVL